MKVYTLNVNTAQPTYQILPMQQNQRGLLSVSMTNNGKYIRDLSVSVFDGDTEIQPETEYGFPVEVGTDAKNVKVVAKSEPIMSEWEEIVSSTDGNRAKNFLLKRLQLPAGTYKVKELLHLANLVNSYQIWRCNLVEGVPTSNCYGIVFNGQDPITRKIIPISFLKQVDVDAEPIVMGPDEDIIVAEGNVFSVQKTLKASAIETTTTTYPAVGYYTDYQKDTLIRPSLNAPYDGEYTEPLSAVEIDGKKYEPTTLSVDGVAYSVLAAVPNEEPETEPEVG